MQTFELNEQQLSELISLVRPLIDTRLQRDFDSTVRNWIKHPQKPLDTVLRERGLLSGSAPASSIASMATAPLDSQSEPANLTKSSATPQFELTQDSDLDARKVTPHRSQVPSRGGTPEPIRSDMQATLASGTIGGGTEEVEAAVVRAGVTTRLRFEYVRPLDKGGLGIVDVARDRELGREVALKRIRPDKSMTPLYRSKFIREAEVTGNLEHPGIVPVYGMGLDDQGQPYYAMRLIRGRTLSQRVRKFLSEEGKGPQPFQTAEFQRLIEHFITVCQTIAFAHDRGVLHRDLKPVNIMVGKYGETFVVDWGLAKSMADPLDTMELPDPSHHAFADDFNTATRYGTALGTPAYAPPEQVLGKLEAIDERSDIYGLGSILFEMLTGEPPVTGKNITELIQRAGNGELRQVLSLRPDAPKALAAICHHCLHTDPTHRYSSVTELIKDIEAWRADHPVSVHAESWLSRVHRWIRHHRGATIASAIGLMTVAIITSLASAVIFQQKEQVARLAQEEQLARQSAETVRDFLVDAFESPNPERDGRTVTVEEILKRAGDKIDHDLAQEPDLQTKMNVAIGRSFLGLGLPREAIGRLSLAAQKASELFGEDSLDAILAHQKWAVAMRQNDELEASVTKLREVLAHSESKLGVSHQTTLDIMVDLGDSLRRVGDFDAAISVHRQVFDQRRHDFGIQHSASLKALHGLALTRLQAGLIQEASEDFLSVYQGRKTLLGPTHLDTLASQAGHAECLLLAGRADLAIAQYREVLDGQTERLGEVHPIRLATLSDLAGAYRKSGDDQQAIDLLEEAQESMKQNGYADSLEAQTIAGNLAVAYEAAGQIPKSIEILKATLEAKKAKFDAEHPEVLTGQQNLAYAYQSEGNYAAAEAEYAKVVDARIKRFGRDHIDTLAAMAGHAEALTAMQRFDQAQKLLEEVLVGQKKLLAADHPDIGRSQARLADAQRRRGQLETAASSYEEAIQQLKKTLPDNHPDLLAASFGQAMVWLATHQTERAIEALAKVHQEFKKKGVTHPDTLQVAAALGNAYADAGQLELAIPMLETTTDHMEKQLGADHPERLSALFSLAAAYRKAQWLDQADELLVNMLKRQAKGDANAQREAIQTATKLAHSRLEDNRAKEAIEPAAKAVELATGSYDAYHPIARETLRTLFAAYDQAGEFDHGEKILRQLLEACEKDPEASYETLETKVQLVELLAHTPRRDESIELLTKVSEEWTGAKDLSTANNLWLGLDLARIARDLEQTTTVIRLLSRFNAQALNRKLPERERWEGLTLIGEALLQEEKVDAAIEALRQSVEITSREFPDFWQCAWSRAILGHALLVAKDRTNAAVELEAATNILRSQNALLPPSLRSLADQSNAWLEQAKKPQ